MVLYAISYEKGIFNRSLRCPVDPFAIVPARPEGSGRPRTHPFDAQNDTAQQQDDIQNFVTQQVNAILVNPVDSDAVVPAIEAANQTNIPVIALDRGASGGELATAIASDNVQGGNLAGEELIRLVGSGSVAQQQAEIGSLGVENAISVINGESVEENIPVEVQLVTPENVSEFL